jgi:hypothetical protein
MAIRNGGEFGRCIEFQPADTGINGAAFQTHATTLTSSTLLVDGLCGFNVAAVFTSAGTAASTGGFDLKCDAYLSDGTLFIADHTLASSSGFPATTKGFVVSWIEGDAGSGINMEAFACKPLVGIHSIRFKLVTTASFDNGPFTVKLHVTGVR